MVQAAPDPDDDEEVWATASRELIPKAWRASEPVRLVDARTILLAAMAAFFANVRQAFAPITDTASATMTPAIDRWLYKLRTCTHELLSGARLVATGSPPRL
jgi:hypothetical protein